MAGSIEPGEKGRAEDFLFESEKDATPVNDWGRVPKLEPDQKISRAFSHQSGKADLVAGEAISGASTPKACFIASAQRLNKYNLIASQKDDTEIDFEMYNSGAADRRIGHKFNSGLFDYLTGFAFSGDGEGAIGSHNYIMELYLQDGSGHPTGSVLASKAFTDAMEYSSSVSAEGHFYIPFDTPVAVTQGEDYVLVIRETTTTGSASLNIHINGHTTGGTAIHSTDGGSTWTNGMPSNSSASFGQFAVYGYKALVAGKVYLSDGDDPDRNYFDGFVNDDVVLDDDVDLIWGMDVPLFTGLLPGTEYYLSGTAGSITATKGKGRKVGKARSAEQLTSSERFELSDVYNDDVYGETRAVCDGLVSVFMTDDIDLEIYVSNLYHEVLFGLDAVQSTVTASPTGNKRNASFYIRQGQYVAVAPDRDPNTWSLFANVTSKTQYHL